MNDVPVRKFILFNTSWGRKEGTESEKIIYSSSMSWIKECSSSTDASSSQDGTCISNVSSDPESEAKDDLKQISLCEASVGFVDLFKRAKASPQVTPTNGRNDKDQEAEEIPYKMDGYAGTTLVFRRIEKPGFWLMAVLPAPMTFVDDGVNPFIIYQLLGSLYTSFQRQNGSLKRLSAGSEDSSQVRVKLRKKCKLFFEWFLPHLDIVQSVSLPSPTPFAVFGGKPEGLMKYLSLDGQSFMSVRSFIQHCTYSCSMSPNMGIIFLYNDNLVTSTLSLMATRVLYSYVVTHVIPDATGDEMSRTRKSRDANSYWVNDGKPTILYIPMSKCAIGSHNVEFDIPSPLQEQIKSFAASNPNEEDELIEWVKKDIYFYRSLNGSTLVVVFDSLESGHHEEDKDRKPLLDSLDIYSRQHLYNLTSMVSKASVMVLKASNLSTTDRHLYFHHQQMSTTSNTPMVDNHPDQGISYLYYNECNGALKTFFQSPTVTGHLSRQVSSAPSLLHQSSTNSLNPLHVSLDNHPFGLWAALESDFRFLLQVKLKGSPPAPPSPVKEEDGVSVCSGSSSTSSTKIRTRRVKRSEGTLEILAKTDVDESWVVMKRCDGRSLLATLSNHKNLNLDEVSGIFNQRSPAGLNYAGGTSSSSNPTTSFFAPFTSLFQ